MPKGKKRREAGGPMSAAGLMRFYEEVDVGIKLTPQMVVIVGIVVAVAVVILRALLPLA